MPLHVLAGRAALEHARGAREEADLIAHRRHLLLGGQLLRLAGVAALDLDQLVGARLDRVGDLQQRALALAGRGLAPGLEGAGRVLEGGVDVDVGRDRRRRVRLAGTRVDQLAGAPVRGGDALAVDEVGDALVPELIGPPVVAMCGVGGTSSAGLRSKNPTGFSQKETVSTDITGHSSGRVMWWMPNTYQRTTSVSSIGRFCAVHSGSPRSASRLWTTNSPHGQRSSASNGVTHSVWPIDLGAAQHRGVRVEHRRERAARHELVGDGRAEPVAHGGVDDLPGALGVPVVVLLALRLGAQRRVALHERQAVRVVRADRQRLGLGGVDRVGLAVDVEVEPGDEEVLVERGVGRARRRACRRAAAAAGAKWVVTMIPVARTSHSMLPSW